MRITVFVDGECPMCVAGALRLHKLDGRHAVHFVNVHDAADDAPIPKRLLDLATRKSMVARMPDGTFRTGYFAWVAMFRAMRRTRLLGALMDLPIFYGLGPKVYRWIADHRQAISQLLRLPPPCNPDGSCRIDAIKNMPKLKNDSHA